MLKSVRATDNFLDARATRLGRAFPVPSPPASAIHTLDNSILCTRPRPSTMSDKKPEPKELSDEYILAAIAKESKEFDKVRLLLYSSLIASLTDHSHPRTPKSIASSKPSVSTHMLSSTYNPVYPTTTLRNATA